MRRVPKLAMLIAPLALAGGAVVANGAVISTQDERGRTIRIDAVAKDVEVGSYARILRNSIHGDEIENVTLRVVPQALVARLCRTPRARACYRAADDAEIIVRAGDASDDAYTILHEYGHHVDASIRHRRAPELNGTPRWWGTRAMGIRLSRGQVASDYSRGWARSVGEIFAEDYAQLHLRGPYGIGWLPRPDESVFRAIRLDLTGKATGPSPKPTSTGLAQPEAPARGPIPRSVRGRALGLR